MASLILASILILTLVMHTLQEQTALDVSSLGGFQWWLTAQKRFVLIPAAKAIQVIIKPPSQHEGCDDDYVSQIVSTCLQPGNAVELSALWIFVSKLGMCQKVDLYTAMGYHGAGKRGHNFLDLAIMRHFAQVRLLAREHSSTVHLQQGLEYML